MRYGTVLLTVLAHGLALNEGFLLQSTWPRTGARCRGSEGLIASAMKVRPTRPSAVMAHCHDSILAFQLPDDPAALKLVIKEKDARIKEKDARIKEKDARITTIIEEKEARIQEKDAFITTIIEEKDARIKDKDVIIQSQKEQLARANTELLRVTGAPRCLPLLARARPLTKRPTLLPERSTSLSFRH
jgi:hypothetical protein